DDRPSHGARVRWRGVPRVGAVAGFRRPTLGREPRLVGGGRDLLALRGRGGDLPLHHLLPGGTELAMRLLTRILFGLGGFLLAAAAVYWLMSYRGAGRGPGRPGPRG